jgi:hypothetical protein
MISTRGLMDIQHLNMTWNLQKQNVCIVGSAALECQQPYLSLSEDETIQ